jgi:hypothetical protein
VVYWLGRGLGAFLIKWEGGTDGSSFVELGCAIPVSGGAQAYLAYSVSYIYPDRANDQFGPLLSYLYTWSAVSSLKPGSTAIISLIFGHA